MFHIQGKEFIELIPRSFGGDLEVCESASHHPGYFSSTTCTTRNEYFDILYFTCRFYQNIRVNAMEDITHVSLHFQLRGYSDARISGLNQPLAMKPNVHNLLNCVAPVSDFIFPQQEHYEYVCVGLKPSFFQSILEGCGEIGDELLKNVAHQKPFGLFKESMATDFHQLQVLRQLKDAPIADSLKPAFLLSKVRELTLLTLGRSAKPDAITGLNNEDIARLHAVREYLSLNFLQAHSLEKISRAFLLNEFKLKTGFRKLFNTTVFGFIHELRMSHGLELIQSGGYSIADISIKLGYESESSFRRAFKLFFGTSPAAVKKG